MNNEKFEQLKSALPSIAETVKQFPDNLQQKVFELLIAELRGEQVPSLPIEDPDDSIEASEPKPQPATKVPKKGTRKRAESYTLDRHLNLRGDGKTTPPFAEFYSQKQPNSAPEFNAIAVYYLKTFLGLETVTLNQVYTCYKEVNRRTPEAFRQSFYDAQSKFGYVEINDQGIVTIPHRGTMFVEHDMPRPKTSKK